MSRKTLRKLAPVVALALMAGCKTVPINPNDSSPPKAEVLVKQANGQWAVASEASLDSGVSVMCRITDQQGVKYARLSFLGASSDSCTVGSSVYNGSFPLKPALPAPMEQSLSGNAQGQVLQVLPLIADVPNVSCTVFGQQQPGKPYGHTITAKCEGKNWSSNSQNQSDTAELKIKVK